MLRAVRRNRVERCVSAFELNEQASIGVRAAWPALAPEL